MSEFTKDELQILKNTFLQVREDYPAMHSDPECTLMMNKLKYLVANHGKDRTEEIVRAHLQQASSLISHAMCLLGMDDE